MISRCDIMFNIDLLSFMKDDVGFWLSVLNVDNYGDFDRALFLLGKKHDVWFLELFYLRITPR